MKKIMIIVLLIVIVLITACVNQSGLVGFKVLQKDILVVSECNEDQAIVLLFELVKDNKPIHIIQSKLATIGCEKIAFNEILE